jgi:hypothetical protein
LLGRIFSTATTNCEASMGIADNALRDIVHSHRADSGATPCV